MITRSFCTLFSALFISNTLFAGIEAELVLVGRPFHVYSPGELGDLHVEVTHEASSVAYSLAVVRTPSATPEFSPDQPVSIEEGIARIPFPKSWFPDLGMYYLHWKISSDEEVQFGSKAIGVMEPVGATDGIVEEDFIFGLAGFNILYSVDPDEVIPLIETAAQAGVESVRMGLMWNAIQPERNRFNWTRFDRILDSVEKSGMEMQVVIMHAPRWTKDPAELQKLSPAERRGRSYRVPPKPEHLSAFLRLFASRYLGHIRLYEIWNEPDIQFWQGTAEEYLAFLQTASGAIRQGNPDAVIISGGIAGMQHPRHNHKLHEMILEDGRDYFDWHGYHKHGGYQGLRKEMERMALPLRSRLGAEDKPLYFNETAVALPLDRELEGAAEYLKLLVYSWSIGARGYHWFSFLQLENQKSNSAYAYRMLNEDRSPRPAYLAMNTASRMLRGREFVTVKEAGGSGRVFVFRGAGVFTGTTDEDLVFVLWKEDPAEPDTLRWLPVPARAHVRQVDLMGNDLPVTRVGTAGAAISLTREPSFVVIESIKEIPEIGESLLVFQSEMNQLTPGKPFKVDLAFSNPSAVSQRLKVLWQLEGNIEEGNENQAEWSVGAGQTGQRSYTFHVPTTIPFGSYSFQAIIELPDMDATFSLEMSREPGLLANRERWEDGEPMVVLKDSTQVVNEMSIDPLTNHRVWAGPDDLSVEAWAHLSAGTLYLSWKVYDDVHSQPEESLRMWKADGVQFGFSHPKWRGYWELGVGFSDQKEPMFQIWRQPVGHEFPKNRMVDVDVQVGKGVVLYRAVLPLDWLGLTPSDVEDHLKYSFIVNDSDGEGLDGFIQLSPGISGGKDDSKFPLLLFPK